MRMKRDEKCIVPYCDVAEESGAKPIYIRITVDGKRVLKKVGALCMRHLGGDDTPAEVYFVRALRDGTLPILRLTLERLEDELRRGFPHVTRIKKVAARIRALEKELLRKDAESNYESSHGSIVDQVLPRRKKKDVAEWRAVSELGKDVLPRLVLTSGSDIAWVGEKVHCDSCDCDNVPDRDKDGGLRCGSCGASIKRAGEP